MPLPLMTPIMMPELNKALNTDGSVFKVDVFWNLNLQKYINIYIIIYFSQPPIFNTIFFFTFGYYVICSLVL